MGNLPQIFNFENSQVRVVNQDGEPWFVVKDVCEVLELGNPSPKPRGGRQMPADSMVENPMISQRFELVKAVAHVIDQEKIDGYNKAIDILDDVCMELTFPGANIFRAEIYQMQRRMQDVVFKMGGY